MNKPRILNSLTDKDHKPPRVNGLTDWIWCVVDKCWFANYDETYVRASHPEEHIK